MSMDAQPKGRRQGSNGRNDMRHRDIRCHSVHGKMVVNIEQANCRQRRSEPMAVEAWQGGRENE